ncbi:hypothetical protein IX51_11815 [uncultured archaeon]|nr:hypothetical protein IX51_11815 [uncultured archaeon]
MMSDYADNQTHKPNANAHRMNKIHYAHSIRLYNVSIEKDDLDFLNSFGHSITVNPNGLEFKGKRSMKPYILSVSECDSFWYRGKTIGVIFEVLTALALNKNVTSLTTKEPISDIEVSNLAEIFKKHRFFESDIRLFEKLFNSIAYENFLNLLKGDFR